MVFHCSLFTPRKCHTITFWRPHTHISSYDLVRLVLTFNIKSRPLEACRWNKFQFFAFCIFPEFYIRLTLMWQLYTGLLCPWQASTIPRIKYWKFSKAILVCSHFLFSKLLTARFNNKMTFSPHPSSNQQISVCDGEIIWEWRRACLRTRVVKSSRRKILR